MWDSYPIGDRPLGWIELNENGWGAIAAWFAGPENVVREPMGERSDLVRVTCETADGTSSCWTETITGEVVQDIEDGIDSYLRDSGLPGRPHGYRWFLRLPAVLNDEQEFWGRLNEADFRMPHRDRDMIREAANLGATIKDLYLTSTIE
ncbi:DUF5956 family protein [Paeniglutamicibacter sp. ORCA_105]|uniref:DUF5956 family protein n=1 Tax=Paeniglutamicibacter sp. ORCA_105 TaxID=3377336 RepID=UPI003894C4BB